MRGGAARASAPCIEQLALRPPPEFDGDELELRAYRARRRAERAGGAYLASLSFRTVTYKALCAADQLAAFYADLLDPGLAVPFGIFHQRFSTNTAPSWERAQPFRLLCHNGEINTIEGNAELGDDVRSFYRYHATLVEPWDGPAGIVFTDGRVVGAALDRNGLRPLRVAVADDGLIVCASE